MKDESFFSRFFFCAPSTKFLFFNSQDTLDTVPRSLARPPDLLARRRRGIEDHTMPAFDGGGVGGSRREEDEQGVANAKSSPSSSAASFNAPTCSTNRVRQLASSWPPPPASTATEDARDGNKAQKQGE